MATTGPSQHLGVKVHVVGAPGVGKTCLTTRLCGRDMPENPAPTIFMDIKLFECDVDESSKSVYIQFYDTSCDRVGGREKNVVESFIAPSLFPSHAIIFMYDLSQPQTLDYLVDMWKKYVLHAPRKPLDKPLFFLVGNKYDLVSDQWTPIVAMRRKSLGMRYKEYVERLSETQKKEYEMLNELYAMMESVGVVRVVYMSVLCNSNGSMRKLVNTILIASSFQHPDHTDKWELLLCARKRMAAYTKQECGRFVHDVSICAAFHTDDDQTPVKQIKLHTD